MRRLWPALLALPFAACRDRGPVGVSVAAPRIAWIAVDSNPTNALAALVRFDAPGADSARLVFWSSGAPAVTTPYIDTHSGGRIVALGLLPQTTYHGRLEVVGGDGSVTADSLVFASRALPGPLQGVRLAVSGTAAPGYFLTGVTAGDTAYAVAFDGAGVIRWYRGFAAQPGEHALACEQQPSGDFTLFVGASPGWLPVAGRYYAFTPAGDSVAAYTAGVAYYTDPHELLQRADGSREPDVYLLGYDLRGVDLTALGGGPNQLVAGHTILRLASNGAVEFRWSAWDHFALDEWVARPPDLTQTPLIDFDHPNSIELDADGNYIVSFASLTQIVKIDPSSGAMRWRFGGRRGQFTLVGDPLGGFGIQHDVRVLPNGDLLFFDNGTFHNPPESRAVEYRLDTLSETATLVWEYRPTPPVFAPIVGSAQRYANGRTLVGFGAAGVATEVTPDGTPLWEGRLTVGGLTPTLFYRIRRVPSLYAYHLP